MTAEQFQRVKAIYLDLAGLTPDAARTRLPELCGDDDAVRAEVLKMLGVASDDTMLLQVNRQVDQLLLGPAGPGKTAGLVGQRVGAYDVTGILGHGGMGVVYLARDTRLGRPAALKAVLSGDDDPAESVERLRREARLLASLSHPNVAVVYGLEESHGTLLIAMEYVDGPTLSHKLGRGGLPIADALRYCIAIAAGVEAAHGAGVIHRDLKPGNVVIAADGTPKVLDFGLARQVHPATADSHVGPRHATLTRHGSFMGTPAYMSPEQVRGEPAGVASDIFSFGAVLFRCLAGRPAFHGETDLDRMDAILNGEPDWSQLPAITPSAVRRALRRCLAKDASDRYRHIGDVRLDLVDALAERAWVQQPARPKTAGRVGRIAAWCAFAAGLALAAGAYWSSTHDVATRPPLAATNVRRFESPLPGNAQHSDLERLQVALSASGRELVVACRAPGNAGIWRWNYDDGQWRFVTGTENGHRPVVSPDGEWVGFFRDDYFYKQRTNGRGEPVALTPVSNWYGGSWAGDGSLVVAPAWGAGLQRIDAAGRSEQLSKLNPKANEFAHVSPHAVAGSPWVLYGVWTGGEQCAIHAVNLNTKQQHVVVANASTPRVARTPAADYLLFERASIIFAVPFDRITGRATGPEAAVAEGVMNDGTRFAAYFDVADDGTLAYFAGASFTEANRLSYVTSDGSTEPLGPDRLSFAEPMFSANGDKLSATIKGKLYRLLVYDLRRQTKEYLLVGGDVVAHAPSPDGKQIAVSVNRDGGYALDLLNLPDGALVRRLVEPGADYQSDRSWSADGKRLTFTMSEREGVPRDVWIAEADGRTKPRRLVASPAADMHGAISPNGNWVAYTSETSGRREVYLVHSPGGGGRRQVSFDGGESPAWSPDGRRLYYVRPGGLVSVEIADDGSVTGRPSMVYDKPFGQSDTVARNYTIAPDGRPVIVEPSEHRPSVGHVNVITQWPSLLNR